MLDYLWFLELEKYCMQLNLKEFKHLWFEPSMLGTNLSELVELHQSRIMDDYQRLFEQLAIQASSTTYEQEVEIFLEAIWL